MGVWVGVCVGGGAGRGVLGRGWGGGVAAEVLWWGVAGGGGWVVGVVEV